MLSPLVSSTQQLEVLDASALAKAGGACFEKLANQLNTACTSGSEAARTEAALAVARCRKPQGEQLAGCRRHDDVATCTRSLKGDDYTLFALAQSQLDTVCEDLSRRIEERKTQELLRELSSIGPELVEHQQNVRDELKQGQSELLSGQQSIMSHTASAQSRLDELKQGQSELSSSLSDAKAAQAEVKKLQEQQRVALETAFEEQVRSAQTVRNKLQGAITAAERVEGSINAAGGAIETVRKRIVRGLGPFVVLKDALAHIAVHLALIVLTLPASMRRARFVAALKLTMASTLEWLEMHRTMAFVLGYDTAKLLLRSLLWASASVDVLSQAVTDFLPKLVCTEMNRSWRQQQHRQLQQYARAPAVINVHEVGVQVDVLHGKENQEQQEQHQQTRVNSPQSDNA